jgi:hypothetical protein
MTSFALEHFGIPASRHEAREFAYAEEWAVDDLSSRTTWCATASPGRRSAGQMLGRLRAFGEQRLDPQELNVPASEPLLELTRRLHVMLQDRPGPASELAPGDGEIWAEARADSDVLVGENVRADDLVVLHDPLTVMLAEALRERGAHAVWNLDVVIGSVPDPSAPARRFLGKSLGAVHAYVITWRRPTGAARRIAAIIPSAELVAAKDVDETPSYRHEDVAWASALADVIRADRAETVGGRLHARPTVAAR